MQQWPADDKTVDFEDIVEPICEAIRFAYILQRQNAGRNIPYRGFDVGDDEAHALRALRQLSAKNLAYSEHEQNRDPLTEIVSLAIRLGIEQGRRIFKNSNEYRTIKTYADMADLFIAENKSSRE